MEFDPKHSFVGFPSFSIEVTEAIVNEAQKCNARPFKRSKRAIGFEPNAVEIENVGQRLPGGVSLSLYGGPERYNHKLIKPGRTTSYSRAKIETRSDLDAILPIIRKAFWLKSHN